MHLRIKTAQKEYEEILNKRLKDITKIKDLEETILLIKNQNGSKAEKLNSQLKEYEEALGRRDHLVNENYLLNEKYEKAIKDLNLCIEVNEQAEAKCSNFSKELEKLIEKLESKEKSFNFLLLNKKQIESELVKQAEIYGFIVNKNIFRISSISDVDNENLKLLKVKGDFAAADKRRISSLYRKKSSNENGIFFSLENNNLHSIYENSDDNENEKFGYESNNKDNNFSLDYVCKENQQVSYSKQPDFNGKIKSRRINVNNNILDTSIETYVGMEFDTPITSDKISEQNNNNENSESFNYLNRNNHNSLLASAKITAADFISKKQLNVEDIKKDKVPEAHDLSKIISNKLNNRPFIKGINKSSIFKSSNYLINRRISLKDIIDADLEDFDKTNLTRRQSIVNFIGNTSHSNIIADQYKNKNQPNKINREIINKNFEISYSSVEITKKALNYRPEDSELRFGTDFTESNQESMSDLKVKIDELTLKNIELQSILANEKFEKECEIKLQQMKIEKLNSALQEFKKKIKGK